MHHILTIFWVMFGEDNKHGVQIYVMSNPRVGALTLLLFIFYYLADNCADKRKCWEKAGFDIWRNGGRTWRGNSWVTCNLFWEREHHHKRDQCLDAKVGFMWGLSPSISISNFGKIGKPLLLCPRTNQPSQTKKKRERKEMMSTFQMEIFTSVLSLNFWSVPFSLLPSEWPKNVICSIFKNPLISHLNKILFQNSNIMRSKAMSKKFV